MSDLLYYTIHKQVFNEEFDLLDPKIRQKVMNFPSSREGELFARRVDHCVRLKLGATFSSLGDSLEAAIDNS